MPMAPIAATLSSDVQRLLSDLVKPKFDAYFLVTSSASGHPRAVPDPHGQPWFIYSNETLISDLTFLWSLFADVYQAVGGPEPLASFVRRDPYLMSHFHHIVGASQQDPDGEFWHVPAGLVPPQQSGDQKLGDVLRTLRNGFAHSHWFFADLNALDYWNALGWETGGAPAAFNLQGRVRKNCLLYIADGRDFNPHAFWAVKDLRILVTQAPVLRYYLHRFLNFVLNGSQKDVFQA